MVYVLFIFRSPPTARKSGSQQSSPANTLTTPVLKQRSRSPTPQPQKKLQFNDEKTNNSISALATSPHVMRRSESPSPRRIPDFQKRKQHSLDSNPSNLISPAGTQLEKTIEEVNKIDGIEVTAKSDNISDNGSEISDEGYRSLGIIQTNNKRASLHSEASNDEADSTIRSNENDVHTSTESPGSELSSKLNELSSPDTAENEIISKNNFECAGIHVDDDEITVDIASATGLRKTGFSNNLYDNDGNIKKPVSKIPRSPVPARRKSVDNSNVISPPQTPNTSGLSMNRKLPVYRSVRKLNRNEITSPPVSAKLNANKKEGISTWSGRAATKTRSSLSPSTYQQPTSSSFNRNSSTRSSSSNLYDKSVRRNSKSSSVNTSPVKKTMSPSSTATSPLAQEILQVAGNYKNDTQILEKMKELLNKYAKNKQQETLNEFDDFTARWVNSSGSPDIAKTANQTTVVTSPKSLSKRSSTVSSSDSTNSKDVLTGIPTTNVSSTQSRKDHRGCSKIPAPVRLSNTEIY